LFSSAVTIATLDCTRASYVAAFQNDTVLPDVLYRCFCESISLHGSSGLYVWLGPYVLYIIFRRYTSVCTSLILCILIDRGYTVSFLRHDTLSIAEIGLSGVYKSNAQLRLVSWQALAVGKFLRY
jgi:hypothetical protein